MAVLPLKRYRLDDRSHALGDDEAHAHELAAGLRLAAFDLRCHLDAGEPSLPIVALNPRGIGADASSR